MKKKCDRMTFNALVIPLEVLKLNTILEEVNRIACVKTNAQNVIQLLQHV